MQDARAPVDGVQRQGDDLAGPESVGRDQEEDRVIPEPEGGRPVDGRQERADGGPGERARELFLAVTARGIDLEIQPGRYPPLGGQEAQEAPEFGDRMLERGPAVTDAGPANKRLDLLCRHRGEARRGVIVGQMGEEVARGATMLPERRGRQAPQVAEGGRVGVDTHISQGRRGGDPFGQVPVRLQAARQASHRPGDHRIPPPVPAPACVEPGVREAAGVVLEIPVDPEHRPQQVPPTTPRKTALEQPGLVGSGDRAQHGQGEEALAGFGEEIGEHRPLLVRVPPVAQGRC